MTNRTRSSSLSAKCKTHGRNGMPDATVARSSEATSSGKTQHVDVAVVGAGFAGLYLLHRLRKAGFSAPCWRRPTTSAAPGTGTAIPARAATSRPSTTATPSIRNWRRRGNGRRNTPPSLRSCAISASSPTVTTSGATSASAPRSQRRAGMRATERWLLTTDDGADGILPLLHHGDRLPLCAKAAGDRRRQGLQGRGLFHRPLAA